MRPVTMYRTDDGTTYATAEAAEEHEALAVKVNAVLAELRPRPEGDGCRFANGEGYIQQPAGSYHALWAAVKRLGTTRDSGKPLSTLLWRAQCLDEKDREYGQPYFAAHPGEVRGGPL